MCCMKINKKVFKEKQSKFFWIYVLFLTTCKIQVSLAYFIDYFILYYTNNCKAITANVTFKLNTATFQFNWIINNGVDGEDVASKVWLDGNGKVFKNDIKINGSQIEIMIPSNNSYAGDDTDTKFFSSLRINTMNFTKRYIISLARQDGPGSLMLADIVSSNCSFPAEIVSTGHDQNSVIICDNEFDHHCSNGAFAHLDRCPDDLGRINKIVHCEDITSISNNKSQMPMAVTIFNVLIILGVTAIIIGTAFLNIGLCYNYFQCLGRIRLCAAPNVWKMQGYVAIGCGIVVCGIAMLVGTGFGIKLIGGMLILLGATSLLIIMIYKQVYRKTESREYEGMVNYTTYDSS